MKQEETAEQFMDSTKALEESERSMKGLQESFGRLTERFDSLYDNIEVQNSSVNQVDAIFGDLKARAMEMQSCSTDNQGAVEAIVDAMELYKVNINHVVENTRNIETN